MLLSLVVFWGHFLIGIMTVWKSKQRNLIFPFIILLLVINSQVWSNYQMYYNQMRGIAPQVWLSVKAFGAIFGCLTFPLFVNAFLENKGKFSFYQKLNNYLAVPLATIGALDAYYNVGLKMNGTNAAMDSKAYVVYTILLYSITVCILEFIKLYQKMKSTKDINEYNRIRFFTIGIVLAFILNSSFSLNNILHSTCCYEWGVEFGYFLFLVFLSVIVFRYKAFNIDAFILNSLMWLALSAMLLVPAGLAYLLLDGWFGYLNLTARLLVFTVVFGIGSWSIYWAQPRLDKLFHKHKYNLGVVLRQTLWEVSGLLDSVKILDYSTSMLQQSLNVANSYAQLTTGIKTISGIDVKTFHDNTKKFGAGRLVFDRWEFKYHERATEFHLQITALLDLLQANTIILVERGDKLLALIGIGDKLNRKTLSEEEIHFLTDFSLEIALGLHNALMFRDVQDKKEELEYYNQNLARTVQERTKELQESFTTIQEANSQILASIRYGQVIQFGMLPAQDEVAKSPLQSTVVWEPKDIVSGDIYYCLKVKDAFYWALFDCTGHGVPGAFMTFLTITAFQRALQNENIVNPSEVLMYIHRTLRATLHTKVAGQNNSDFRLEFGVEGLVCRFDLNDPSLCTYASSRMPLFLLTGEEDLTMLKAERYSLAYRELPSGFSFTDKMVRLNNADTLFLATDGIYDQIGAQTKLPLGKNSFAKWLKDLYGLSPTDMLQALKNKLMLHKGDQPQNDDMALVALRLPNGK
jgi:serine phosphatase RsbU (regulator of sigma subunit)